MYLTPTLRKADQMVRNAFIEVIKFKSPSIQVHYISNENIFDSGEKAFSITSFKVTVPDDALTAFNLIGVVTTPIPDLNWNLLTRQQKLKMTTIGCFISTEGGMLFAYAKKIRGSTRASLSKDKRHEANLAANEEAKLTLNTNTTEITSKLIDIASKGRLLLKLATENHNDGIIIKHKPKLPIYILNLCCDSDIQNHNSKPIDLERYKTLAVNTKIAKDGFPEFSLNTHDQEDVNIVSKINDEIKKNVEYHFTNKLNSNDFLYAYMRVINSLICSIPNSPISHRMAISACHTMVKSTI